MEVLASIRQEIKGIQTEEKMFNCLYLEQMYLQNTERKKHTYTHQKKTKKKTVEIFSPSTQDTRSTQKTELL